MFFELFIVFSLFFWITLSKVYFYFLERDLPFSVPFFLDWISLFIFIFLIFYYFRKESKRLTLNNKFHWRSILSSRRVVFVFLLILLFVFLSFFIDLRKGALDWDAVALYDARAKFLRNGLTFKDMVNSFGDYYVMYPPFTSIVHYLWHTFLPFFNVSVFYSFNLLLLGFLVFVLTRNEFGVFLSSILALFTVTNNKIFFLSTIEYTNLPFAVFIVAGVFFLIRFLKTASYFYLTGGFLFLALSQWIRFIEPVSFIVGISFILSLFFVRKIRKLNIFFLLFLFFLVFIQRYSWRLMIDNYFGLDNSPFSLDIYLKALSGIFDGSFMIVLFYFLNNRYFGTLLPVYVLSASLAFNKKEVVLNFLFFVILFSLLLFFFGLYFYYFKLPNWRDIADSAARLSIYLIPISVYLVLYRLKSFMEKK